MLGDYYRAEPPLRCPICAEPVYECEGFVGDGRWLVWTEGEPEPDGERSLPSFRLEPEALRAARLPDGDHAIYGSCVEGHRLIAHIQVEDGVWSGTRITDAEGHAGFVLREPWRLWWTLGRLISIAKDRPADAHDVVPATISALGMNDSCILTTRRPTGRQPAGDEWWVIDLAKGQAHGPIPDDRVPSRIAELGLVEPDHLSLPEDLGGR